MNRRDFIARVSMIGAALAALPTFIYYLGKDDTAKLQAMLDRGEPIRNGDYVLQHMLIMRDGSIIEYVRFHILDQGGIDCSQGAGGHICYCMFTADKTLPAAIMSWGV